MVEKVGRPCIQSDALMLVAGEPMGRKFESAAEVGIQMNERGHGSCVSSQRAIDAGGIEQPERWLVGCGTLLRGQRGPVVEYAVSVVIHTGEDVIRIS